LGQSRDLEFSLIKYATRIFKDAAVDRRSARVGKGARIERRGGGAVAAALNDWT